MNDFDIYVFEQIIWKFCKEYMALCEDERGLTDWADDIEKIRLILKSRGICTKHNVCYYMWTKHSNDLCADWLQIINEEEVIQTACWFYNEYKESWDEDNKSGVVMCRTEKCENYADYEHVEESEFKYCEKCYKELLDDEISHRNFKLIRKFWSD